MKYLFLAIVILLSGCRDLNTEASTMCPEIYLVPKYAFTFKTLKADQKYLFAIDDLVIWNEHSLYADAYFSQMERTRSENEILMIGYLDTHAKYEDIGVVEVFELDEQGNPETVVFKKAMEFSKEYADTTKCAQISRASIEADLSDPP